MVNKSDLPAIALEALGDLADKPGGVFYSSHEALRPGEVYFLGYNPGGVGTYPIRETFAGMLTQRENAYLDQCWGLGGKLYPAGKAPMQMRTVHVLESLGLAPRDVCSANLIFVSSVDSKGVEISMADRCWPVHRAVLEIVQPRLIVSCGNSGLSTYGYLKRRFSNPQETSVPSGHGGYRLKHFDAEIDGRHYRILGLPHLSWYKPQGRPEFTEWIREVGH